MNVRIETLGCKVNFAEMAELSDRLQRAGYSMNEQAEPDICVVNTCTVTAQADRKVRTLVHGLRRRHPGSHLVLTGCHVDNPLPRVSAVPVADVAFPNARKHEIFDYLTALFPPETAAGPPLHPRSRFFLKVQDGCDHRCTYCIVWRTRGPSRSRLEEELVEQAQAAVADGYGEVVLTGVDLGSYGRQDGRNLAGLVRQLLSAIRPARLRLSSVNANDFTDELIELVGGPGFCPHLHIPLQSGSDRILKRMGRLYRRDGYLAVVNRLRQREPEIALTTDVIVGFPGETEEDFRATAELAWEAGFSGMHVFRYSPRAGTAAPRLGLPVNDPVSRDRSHRLEEQAERQRLAYESAFLGRPLEVVWDRRFKEKVRGLSANYISLFASDRGQRLGALETVLYAG